MKNKNLFVIIDKNRIEIKEGLFYENSDFCIIVNNHLYDLNYKKENLKKLIDYYNDNIELFNIISNNFSAIIIDKNNKKLTCIQDLNGDTIPIYYKKENNQLVFSNKLINIIDNFNEKPEMNQESISYFMKKGYIFNKSTLLKDIYKLIPNYNLVINFNDKYKEKHIKKKIKYVKINKDNTDLYINEFKKIINNREKNKKVYVTLSNGYDSNFIFRFLDNNKPIEAFSIGGVSGRDETIMVQENIKSYHNTNLNISYVR